MKTILFLFLFVALTFSQELNESSNLIKKKLPDIYSQILASAKTDWGSDHRMIIYEVNRQCGALVDLSDLTKKHPVGTEEYTIIIQAASQWPNDYAMMLYEAKKQLKSYEALK